MCIFSKYKDIFGEAGKGVHSYRFLNTALVPNQPIFNLIHYKLYRKIRSELFRFHTNSNSE